MSDSVHTDFSGHFTESANADARVSVPEAHKAVTAEANRSTARRPIVKSPIDPGSLAGLEAAMRRGTA